MLQLRNKLDLIHDLLLLTVDEEEVDGPSKKSDEKISLHSRKVRRH
jgi:hypothetical protein